MYHYQQDTWDKIRDKDGNLLVSKYFYGSQAVDDYLFRNPKSLPLYGHLARKILMHYAGEYYNPHTIHLTMEPHIRMLIKSFVEYKVFYKIKGYDWELIDHFFRKVVDDYYNLGLKYDQAVIDRGYGLEFTAPALIDYKKPV